MGLQDEGNVESTKTYYRHSNTCVIVDKVRRSIRIFRVVISIDREVDIVSIDRRTSIDIKLPKLSIDR